MTDLFSSIATKFQQHQWEKLVNLYSPNEIIKLLSFKDGLRFAYRLLYNRSWDENLQKQAVDLFYEIRKTYPQDWHQSWEYNALLGLACYITKNYEERYEAYKQAFNMTEHPQPGLLIELARCCICPGPPPISYEDAIHLVKKALEEAPYADAIGLLSHIYSLKNDKKNEEYWNEVLKKSDQKFISPSIEPKFLVEEYLQEEA